MCIRDSYYTVKAREPYYGETFQWNGICLLAPYQMGPTLKTLKLKIWTKIFTMFNSNTPACTWNKQLKTGSFCFFGAIPLIL